MNVEILFVNHKGARPGETGLELVVGGWWGNALSNDFQKIAPFRCEFEACQARSAAIQIFCEREHLKSATQHFGMKQRLQFALGLARSR